MSKKDKPLMCEHLWVEVWTMMLTKPHARICNKCGKYELLEPLEPVKPKES